MDLAADDVRSLIRQLDAKFPGIGIELGGDAVAVAIDGDIYPDALLEPLEPDSEVYFMPAIKGG